MHILANAGVEITNFIANIVYASDTMMAQHPDQLRKFLAGYFETIRYMKDHKAETIKITPAGDAAFPTTSRPRATISKCQPSSPTGISTARSSPPSSNRWSISKLIDHAVPDDTLITEKFLQ